MSAASKPTYSPEEQIEMLVYAVERLTVEVQQLAVRLETTIGTSFMRQSLDAMGDVNRRLCEVFPEPDPPRTADGL